MFQIESLAIPQNSDRGIYVIFNIRNGKFYLGSCERFGDRWAEHRRHLDRGTHHSKHLQAAWKKWGPDSFQVRMVEYVGRDVGLLPVEDKWLQELRPFDRAVGYNACHFATSVMKGRKLSEEARKAKSLRQIGRKMPPRTQEYRQRQSEIRKGKRLPASAYPAALAANTGKPLSAERKRKISEANKRRDPSSWKWSEASKAKASAARKGCPGRLWTTDQRIAASLMRKGIPKGPVSEETRARMSAAQRGHPPMSEDGKARMIAAKTGVSHPISDETKRKISAANSGLIRSREYCERMSAARKRKPWSEARRKAQLTKGENHNGKINDRR